MTDLEMTRRAVMAALSIRATVARHSGQYVTDAELDMLVAQYNAAQAADTAAYMDKHGVQKSPAQSGGA